MIRQPLHFRLSQMCSTILISSPHMRMTRVLSVLGFAKFAFQNQKSLQQLTDRPTKYMQTSLQKLTVPQVVKKFPTFYRIWMFITIYPYPEPGKSSPSPPTLLYWDLIYFNIILPPTSRSSKQSPSLKFPHQNPVCILFPHHACHIPHPFLIFVLIIPLVFDAIHKSWSAPVCLFLQSPVTSSSL